MNERYVILTGGKNNAGDFLIKHRAKSLFASLRPNREIIDYDGWKPIDDEQLKTINASKALILTGGPALQPQMYPRIYPLVDNLDRIKVPILTMAIGWKGKRGTWEEAYNYPLSEKTLHLLNRIESSGYMSSVRDYHTLSALKTHGYRNYLVTGCAALYSLKHLEDKQQQRPIKQVTFSAGVSFFKNKTTAEVNRRLILNLREMLPETQFTVAFHHSVDPGHYKNTYNSSHRLLEAQLSLIDWLQAEKIRWVDISGNAEAMLNHYLNCDLHVGYRVHAHILMASIPRPTVLIAEDGRGIALREVLGGIVFNACHPSGRGFYKFLSKMPGAPRDSLMENCAFPSDLTQQIRYEVKENFPRMGAMNEQIKTHYKIMKEFVGNLP